MRFLKGWLVVILTLLEISLYSQQIKEKTKTLATEDVRISTNVLSDKNKVVENDPMLRRKNINDIVFARDISKVDEIAKYMYDENKLVRMAAIEGLGTLRAEKYSDAIIDILMKETDRDLKNSCIIALSYMPSLNTKKLLDYYKKETEILLKAQMIRLFGARNEKSVEKEMMKIASSSKNPSELRIAAVYYLGAVKSTDSISILRDLVQGDDKLLKMEAIRVIGDIGDKSSIDIIKARAGEKDDDIKIESVLSLAKLGDNSMLESVYEYIDSQNLSYREKVLTAAGIAGDIKTLTFLEEKLKKVEDPNLKSFISFTIERIKARLNQRK